jgi:hypothetical protein
LVVVLLLLGGCAVGSTCLQWKSGQWLDLELGVCLDGEPSGVSEETPATGDTGPP